MIVFRIDLLVPFGLRVKVEHFKNFKSVGINRVIIVRPGKEQGNPGQDTLEGCL